MRWPAPLDVCPRPEPWAPSLLPFILPWAPRSLWLQEIRALPANGSREKARSEHGLGPQGGHHLCFPAGPTGRTHAPGSAKLRAGREVPPHNMPGLPAARAPLSFAMNASPCGPGSQCVFGDSERQSVDMMLLNNSRRLCPLRASSLLFLAEPSSLFLFFLFKKASIIILF